MSAYSAWYTDRLSSDSAIIALRYAHAGLKIACMDKPDQKIISDHPGDRFKALRAAREMTLQNVCDAMAQLGEEMNTGNLSRFERQLEDFSLARIRRLARVYEVHWGDVCSTLPLTGMVIARAYGALPPPGQKEVDQAVIRAQLEATGKGEGLVHVRHTGAGLLPLPIGTKPLSKRVKKK